MLFAARRAPYPLNNGARIRTYHLLTGLARSFETCFVTLEHHPDSADGQSSPEQLKELLPGIEVIIVRGAGPRKRADQAASLVHSRSWTFGRYRSAELRAALRQTVESHRPQVVHFDDPGVALSGPFAAPLNVYSSHNVEQSLLRLQAQQGEPARRMFAVVEARKVAREERRIWREMDICLAVSEPDRAAMRAGGARRVELCPNGVAEVQPLPRRARADGEPLRLLFVGSGSYLPYERGLSWMVKDVLPRVVARVPVTFDVVGSPPANPVAADSVRYVGTVPVLEPYYDRAHVVVVPVFEGGGTRLKVIEAAAYGRPVVSTGLGAEGLPLSAGADFLRADDAEQFAGAIVTLAGWWRQPAEAPLAEMLDGARERVRPLTWGRIVDRLAGLYRSELEPVAPPDGAKDGTGAGPSRG